MTLAKGLGGGLPIGALVIGERLRDVFAPGDHGSTFAGGPVVSTAALTPCWTSSTTRPSCAACASRASGCSRACASFPACSSARGRGLMVACEVADGAPELARRALLEQHLIINATGPTTLRFLPPLIVTAEQVDDALGRLRALF